MQLFGLKTCDTCRKAAKTLADAGKEVEFIDIRATPLSPGMLTDFLQAFGEDALINRRSTTWRGLSDAQRAGDPMKLLHDHPALMKRPVIVNGDIRTLGWTAQAQAVHLG